MQSASGYFLLSADDMSGKSEYGTPGHIQAVCLSVKHHAKGSHKSPGENLMVGKKSESRLHKKPCDQSDRITTSQTYPRSHTTPNSQSRPNQTTPLAEKNSSLFQAACSDTRASLNGTLFPQHLAHTNHGLSPLSMTSLTFIGSDGANFHEQ